MNASIWSDESSDGARALRAECSAWSLSPDDQWIAWAEASPDEAGQMGVWCAEVSSGRVVFEKRGRPVKALAFTSPEALLVVRDDDRIRARAVLYAVPDGGVLGSVSLDALPGQRCKIEVARGAPVALVAPVSWHALPRANNPARRLAHVLRTDPLEAIGAYDPDETGAVPRVPEVRMAVASLSPDGHRLIVWLGAPSVNGILGVDAGTVLSHDWTKRRDTRLATAAHLVRELAWMGPQTLVMRSAVGDELAHRGDLDVLDLARPELLFSTVGEDLPDGWLSGRSTVDVHPDRERLVITGRVATGAAGAKAWRSYVREVVPGEALSRAPREVTSNAAVAMGAAWLPTGHEGVALLRARTQREGEIVRLRTIDGALDRTPVTVAFTGKKPRSGALSRSAGGTMMVARWLVDPEAAPHARRRGVVTGAVSATRLALIDVERLAAG